MKITPRCAACILYARTRELERIFGSTSSEGVGDQVAYFSRLLEAVQLYFVPDVEVASLAAISFKRLVSMVGSNPYDREKQEVYDVAREKAKGVRDLVYGARTRQARLRLAVLASAMATRVESYMTSYEPPSQVEIIAAKLEKDDTPLMDHMLSTGGYTVYYLPASIAELPYDYILLDLLRESYDVRIIAMVRREPYMDFVTTNDLGLTELEDHVDEILEYPGSTTVTKDEAPEAYEKLQGEKIIVVVKGILQTLYMANNPPSDRVFGLFYAYCDVAARVLGTTLNSLNAMRIKGHGSQEY